MDNVNYVYLHIEFRKAVYGMSKAGALANTQLKKSLYHMAMPHAILLPAYDVIAYVPSPSSLLSTNLVPDVMEKSMLTIYTAFSPSDMKKLNNTGQVNYFVTLPSIGITRPDILEYPCLAM